MPRTAKPPKSDKTDKNDGSEKGKRANPQATRETVESIAIAVILAFLFRGFVAEAFVIPTGSMAPTLMGRHIDVLRCPECEYAYQTGASDENPPNDQRRFRDVDANVVRVTFCPICRFPLELNRDKDPNQRSFTGDRILVSKYEYELHDPKRWDVIVFKFPFNAKINYIKRLVGLPNELLRIYHGDIYVGKHLFDIRRSYFGEFGDNPDWTEVRREFARAGHELSDDCTFELEQERPRTNGQPAQAIWAVHDNDKEMVLRLPDNDDVNAQVFDAPRIIRKPPKKQLALLQIVDDTKYQSKKLIELNWPSRWQDSVDDRTQATWSELDPGTYVSQASSADWGWLRYRHIYPSDNEWVEMLENNARPPVIEREQGSLITDYYTYNDKQTGPANSRDVRDIHHPFALGNHWVGDLAVECEIEVQSEQGDVALDLVESGAHYRCTFDVAKGRATLTIDGESSTFVNEDGTAVTSPPTAETEIRGAGKYKVRFVNADDQLQLWVNGDVVTFDGPTTYLPPAVNAPRWSPEDPGDLAPIGVGVRQAVVKLNRLKVLRDVYYVAAAGSTIDDDYGIASNLQEVFRNPETWQSTKLFDERKMAEFVIGPHKYMPLGDNSPQSSDGRLWGYKPDDPDELKEVPEEPVFDEEQLIGKAMLIYWPHGWRRPVPFTPNFRRMRLIH